MAILITGATGFLGSALLPRLVSHGYHDLRCMVRPSSNLAAIKAFQRSHPETRIETQRGNLASLLDLVRAMEGVDTIYHLAAGMRGAWAEIVANSVVASRNVLDAAMTVGVRRLVLISSFSVYGVSDLPRGAVVNEETPLEPAPEKRDPYAYGKLRQEQLFHDYQARFGFDLTILRPGVIYGPGGAALSTRIGLRFPGFFLHVGGSNALPLSYVDNCAEAIALAGIRAPAGKQIYNVHDDDLPTCAAYLRAYRRRVERLRSVRAPYAAMSALSRGIEWYHRHSQGQLPAFLTPYKTAALWKGNRFDNRKLKSLGWRQLIPTAEALDRTFEKMQTNLRPA